MHEEILAPANTPAWMLDRVSLWNAVELAERRKDAQLSREVQLALPCEMSASARLSLVRTFVAREFVGMGMIADVAIHEPHRKGDTRNHHAHIMLTLREITAAGFGQKNRDWNDRGVIEHWRRDWADEVNRALVRAGIDQRVDHRTLEAQRQDAERQAKEARAANDNARATALEIEAVVLDRDPQPKLGHIATALERRGVRTERGDLWRAVVARNVARLQNWLRLQRERLGTVWEMVQAVFDRGHDRPIPPRDTEPHREDRQRTARPKDLAARSYSQEERDRLLGRGRPDAGADGDDPPRPARSPRPRGKGRDDDLER